MTPECRRPTCGLRRALCASWIGLVALAALVPTLHGQPPATEESTAIPETPLEAEVSADDDERLRDSLLARMSALPGLEDPAVDVTAGVVVLRGQTRSGDVARIAAELANRVEGVAAVINRIETIQEAPLERVLPKIGELRASLRSLLLQLPAAGLALVLLVLAWLLARFVRTRRQPFERLFEHAFVRQIMRQLASAIVFVLGLVAALEIVDATSIVAAVLGTAGVAGLALGFAFRDLAENYIASILLSLRQPFAPNDHVLINDKEGRVIRLTTRATILMTLDGNHLRIPNSEVFKATVLNYSLNPTRRFSIDVGVASDVDLLEVQDLGLAALRDLSGVMSSPAPTAVVIALGDSNVQLRFSAWVDQREFDFSRVKGDAIRRLKTTLDDAQVEMPEPIYRLKIDSAGALGLPEAVRRELSSDAESPPSPRRDREAPLEDLRSTDEIETLVDSERQREDNLLTDSGPRE